MSRRSIPWIASLLILWCAVGRAQNPTITGVVPLRADVGSTVAIHGAGFSVVAEENAVWCGAVRAHVSFASTSELQFTVPSGASHAPVTVTVAGRTARSPLPFSPTFPSNLVFGPGSFSGRMEYSSVSVGPYRVAAGDIDGDGRPDLVIANYQGNSVAVRRSEVMADSLGIDSFSAEADLGTGFLPVSLALADIDADGMPDMVIGHQFSAFVSLYMNRSEPGTIQFDARRDVPVNAGFSSIAAVDVDGDGYSDLVVANREGNEVSVCRNMGDPATPTFAAPVVIATGAGPVGLICADWDADGRVDVAVAENSGASMLVARNLSSVGSLAFATALHIPVPGHPTSIAAGDINNDGVLDGVSISDETGQISFLPGTPIPGGISFGVRQDRSTIPHPSAVTLGDVDGDGMLDAAVVSSTEARVFVHRGNLQAVPAHLDAGTSFEIVTPSLSAVVNDLTGNAKPELIAANFFGASVTVMRNAILPPPLLSVATDSLTYPDVRAGDSTALILTVRNLSPAPLTLGSISTHTVTFTPVIVLPLVIGGFDSLLIPIRFRPTTFGVFRDTLSLLSNGGNATIGLYGRSSFPSVVGLPDTIDFGNVPVYSSAARTFAVTNPSVNDLAIDTVIAYAPFGAMFPLHLLRSGDTTHVQFSFTPLASGAWLDSVRMVTNGSPAVRMIIVRGHGLDVTNLYVGTPWNLVSVPRLTSHFSADSLFRRRTGLMFSFDNLSQNYEPATVLANGPGYWAKYDMRDTLVLAGGVVDSIHIVASREGWLLIGSLTRPVPSSSVVTVPIGAIISPVFRFNPESQLYEPSAALLPGEGYWVKVDRPCSLVVR